MAGAWGSSFGDAWGSSWGTDTEIPAEETEGVYSRASVGISIGLCLVLLFGAVFDIVRRI